MGNTPYSGVSLELNRHIANLLDSLSALAALADLTLLGLDRDALLHQALEALMQNQDMERASIFLVDQEEMLLANAAGLDWDELLQILTGTAGSGTNRFAAASRFRVGEGIMGAAAATGELQHCRSIAADPRFKNLKDQPAADGSLLCVPISSEEEILGVLNVFYPVPGFFSIWHERLLLLFCRMLGRLCINQRLFAQMEQMVTKRTVALSTANDHLLDEIDRRRRAEDEVTMQHRFLQAVIDGCMEPIMVINRDHRVRWMNKAAHTLAGDDQELCFCHQISHRRNSPCDSDQDQCPLKLVLEQRGPVTVMHEHFDCHDQPRAMEVIATPFYDEDGSLAGIIESSRDVTERVLAENRLRRRQEEFQYKAYHDPLTGLPNRSFFNIRLHKSLIEAGDTGAEVAILFLDLDGFKQINDIHGHMIGDQLLQLTARRLQESLRAHDTVARFGGDEFVVLLEYMDHGDRDARKVAEKVCTVLGTPFRIDDINASIGASIGISLYPTDSRDADELLQNADSAMYRAKYAGKGCVCFFGDAAARGEEDDGTL